MAQIPLRAEHEMLNIAIAIGKKDGNYRVASVSPSAL
jgi:hypothetical protein